MTAELVFCVPMIPLLFKPPSLVHKLYRHIKAKAEAHIPAANIPLNSLSSNTPPHPEPEPAHIYHNWLTDDDHEGLALSRRIRVYGGLMRNHSRRLRSHISENIGSRAGKILVTTDINIRSHRRRIDQTSTPSLGFSGPPSKEMGGIH